MSRGVRNFLLGVLGVLLVACTGYGAYRAVQVNKAFPTPTTYVHEMNKEIKGGDISTTVTRARLLDLVEVQKIVPEYEDETAQNGKAKILLIDLTFINRSEKEEAVEIVQFYAQSRAWTNGNELPLITSLNKSWEQGYVLLSPKSTTKAYLAYSIYDFQFATKKEWEQVDKRPFELVLSLYPNKNVVPLTLEK